MAYASMNKINHRPVETEKFYHLRKLSVRDIPAMVELSSCIYHSLEKDRSALFTSMTAHIMNR